MCVNAFANENYMLCKHRMLVMINLAYTSNKNSFIIAILPYTTSTATSDDDMYACVWRAIS